MTLYEAVTGYLYAQRRKHGIEDNDYVERIINNLSQYEFLQALSVALEEMDAKGANRSGFG